LGRPELATTERLTNFSATDAVDTGLRILAGADQSELGLRRRLAARGFTDEAVQEAIERLTKFGYLEDKRLSASVTERKLRQGFGRRRVAADLRSRGVDADVIEQTLSGIDLQAEHESCREAAQRWVRTHPAGDARRQRSQLGAALQRRGFAFDVIQTVIQHLDA
jgi:regulatory protein